MARTKQTARKSTGGKAPRRVPGSYNDPDDNEGVGGPLGSALEPPAPMTRAQADLIALEDRYRELFALQRDSSELSSKYVLLHDPFSCPQTYTYAAEDPDEARIPKILTGNRQVGRAGSAITTKERFKERFDEFTGGVLNGLNWDNVFLAGGAVLGNVVADEDPAYDASDIDLFLYGFTTDAEANKKLREIHDLISKNVGGPVEAVRSHRAVTFLGNYPIRHVQVILRLFKSPAEVLLGFDIDGCTAGFDGKNVWATDRFRRALTKGYNLVNITRRSLTYETRLRKYSKRGFAVAVPDLDKARVDPSLFEKNIKDVQGLAKLLLYEHYEVCPNPMGGYSSYSRHKVVPRRFQRAARFSQDEDGKQEAEDEQGESDYAEFYLPWGPRWYSRTILNMLDYKDRARVFQAMSSGNPEDRKKLEVQHMHTFVTGIDGIFEGKVNKYWCRACKAKKPLEDDGSGTHPTGKPLEWVKETPVYQDLDRGFRRVLGIGSFQPVMEENYEKDVYSSAPALASWGATSTAPTEHPFGAPPSSLISGLANLNMNSNTQSSMSSQFAGLNLNTDSTAKCNNCSQTFPSKNKLHEHLRGNCTGGMQINNAIPEALTTNMASMFAPTPVATTTPLGGAGLFGGQGSFGSSPAKMTQTAIPNFFTSATSSIAPQTTFGVPGGQAYPVGGPMPQISTFGSPPRSLLQPQSVFGDSPSDFGAAKIRPNPHSFDNDVTAFGGGRILDSQFQMSSQPGVGSGLYYGEAPRSRPVDSLPSPSAFGGGTVGVRAYDSPADSPAYYTQSPSYNARPAAQPTPQTTKYTTVSSPVAPPTWWNKVNPQARAPHAAGPAMTDPTSQGLLLVGALYKKGAISAAQKGQLKDLVLTHEPLIGSVIEAFNLDDDLAELADSLQRVLVVKGL